MDKKIVERLEYLKTVERAAVMSEFAVVRNSVENYLDSEQYKSAKAHQCAVEQEIAELEEQLQNKQIDINELAQFFDNADFYRANKDNAFTTAEKVAIVIRSKGASHKSKVDYLNSVIDDADETLRTDINEWIAYKQQCIDYIASINRSDVVFLIRFDNPETGNAKVYRTFDAAMQDSMAKHFGLSIEKINEDGGKPQFVLGRIDFVNGEIANVSSMMHVIDESAPQFLTGDEPPRHYSPLYDIKVRFNNPYKPFDMIKLPIRNAYHVVADTNDSKVQAFMKDYKSNDVVNGWIDVTIPVYSQAVLDGGYEYVSCLSNIRCPLSDIEKLTDETMTVVQAKYIEWLKEQVKI